MSPALVMIDIDNTILFSEKSLDSSRVIKYGRGSCRYISAHNLQIIHSLAMLQDTILVLMTGRRFVNYVPVAQVVPHHYAILEHGGEIVCGSVRSRAWERLDCKVTIAPAIDNPLFELQNHLNIAGFRTERFDRKHSFRVLLSDEISQPENLANAVACAIEISPFVSDVVVVQNEEFVDVIPSWSGKLSAARRFADALESPSLASFAAGDGHNDLDVLQWADWVYCARNAVPQVQDAVRSRGGFVSPQESHLGAKDILEKLGGDVAQFLLAGKDA